jgi:hypothetical protein
VVVAEILALVGAIEEGEIVVGLRVDTKDTADVGRGGVRISLKKLLPP